MNLTPAGEKPEPVRTHLRNMLIMPEMIGSVVGVYNGKTFNQVRVSLVKRLLWSSHQHAQGVSGAVSPDSLAM